MRDTFIFTIVVAALAICGLLLFFLGQSTVLDHCDKYGAFKTESRAYTCAPVKP